MITIPADALAAAPAPPTPAATDGDLPEAVILHSGELRLADEGSRPGLNRKEIYDNADAATDRALRGAASPTRPVEWQVPTSSPYHWAERWLTAGNTPSRGFAADLLASLWLGGSVRNLVIAVVQSIILTVCVWFVSLTLTGLGLLGLIVGLAGAGFAIGQVLAFYSNVLWSTARGDDDIELLDDRWTYMEGLFVPLARIVVITLVYWLPVIVAQHYIPADAGNRTMLLTGALLVSTGLWPMAVLLVWMGGSLTYLRPDHVIVSIARIGPVYVFAWGVVLMTFLAWWFSLNAIFAQAPKGWFGYLVVPLWLTAGCFYFGFVLFRTLGVIYRHFGQRLPWKFV